MSPLLDTYLIGIASFHETSSKLPKFSLLLERKAQIESFHFIPLIPMLRKDPEMKKGSSQKRLHRPILPDIANFVLSITVLFDTHLIGIGSFHETNSKLPKLNIF